MLLGKDIFLEILWLSLGIKFPKEQFKILIKLFLFISLEVILILIFLIIEVLTLSHLLQFFCLDSFESKSIKEAKELLFVWIGELLIAFNKLSFTKFFVWVFKRFGLFFLIEFKKFIFWLDDKSISLKTEFEFSLLSLVFIILLILLKDLILLDKFKLLFKFWIFSISLSKDWLIKILWKNFK